MHVTVEAVIDPSGVVRILQPVSIPAKRRALVTILDEPILEVSETTLLSEAALAEVGCAQRKMKHGHTYSRRHRHSAVSIYQ